MYNEWVEMILTLFFFFLLHLHFKHKEEKYMLSDSTDENQWNQHRYIDDSRVFADNPGACCEIY